MAADRTHDDEDEVHPYPDLVKCDSPQSLTFQNFRLLMEQLRAINNAGGTGTVVAGTFS